MFTGKGDVFTEVSCIFSVWPFYTQIERNILKILLWAIVFIVKAYSRKWMWGLLFTYSKKYTKVFSPFPMYYFLNLSPWLVLWLAFLSITNENWTKKANTAGWSHMLSHVALLWTPGRQKSIRTGKPLPQFDNLTLVAPKQNTKKKNKQIKPNKQTEKDNQTS